ncbi:MAG: hypothetical protein CVT66_05945 [Actinobacteria bacterium HGW-Actinobacteria-6]|jgi:hypothetical protein|nr:MAG: hypothetical protein CVT66_05945 [Actinobacteria bacterium HGW-Actinobacteria-6]
MVCAIDARSEELAEAKVRAELASADELLGESGCIAWSGSVFPAVALVKGEPGEGERAGGIALAGPDGDAARKALDALGALGEVWSSVSRPASALEPDVIAARLRMQLLAVDPAVVVALDVVAAADVAAAFRLSALAFGEPVAVQGVTLLAVNGLEASLGDEDRKREVWQQFRGLARPADHPGSTQGTRRRPDGSSLF